jgi:hypothetical protein
MRPLGIKWRFGRVVAALAASGLAIPFMGWALGCRVPSRAEARSFGGYACPDDCCEHAGGYRWAEGRADKSEPFYQGCLAYARDPETWC